MEAVSTAPALVPNAVDRKAGRSIFQGLLDSPSLWTQVGLPAIQFHATTSSDGRIQFTAVAYSPPPNVEVFAWGHEDGHVIGQVPLEPGTYAVVKCFRERFFRGILTNPAKFGEASGHAGLASLDPVEFAGEIEIDEAGYLAAWNLMSGTYEIPHAFAEQAGLPKNLYWRFVTAAEYYMDLCCLSQQQNTTWTRVAACC